ncbi:MAG TPA: copper resistance protein B [Gammaproteobacteria bacterium]|nr:copper resistance protein B [Gammaproteobacteria bacterium]
MKSLIKTLALTLAVAPPAFAGMNDDPLLVMGKLDQFETRDADGPNPLVWDAQGWIGKDLRKLWLKTEGEREDGETTEFEFQALLDRAIAPYWDFQVGWRGDFKPKPTRDWLVIGVQGLAPYFFEVDAALFVGDSGRTSARLDAEYEMLFTQRLILTPEIEVNLFGRDDQAVSIGSGLSDVEAGLRLRYEIRREFAPYIGINWWRKFGGTADFAELAGDKTEDTQLVAGIRAWF